MDILNKFDTAINFLLINGGIFLFINLVLALSFTLKGKIPRKIRVNKVFQFLPKVIVAYDVIAIAISISTLQYNFTKSPEVISKYPQTGEVWYDLSKPLTVVFDRPIKEADLEKHLFPEVKGQWKVENTGDFIKFPRKLMFYPEESFASDLKGTLYITKIRNLLADKNGFDHEDNFKTPSLPNVAESDPKDKSNQVPVSSPITLKLDNPTGQFVDWEIKIQPEVAIKTEDLNDKTKVVKFEKSLAQNTEYTLTVVRSPVIYSPQGNEIIRKGEKEEVKRLIFKTVPNPTLAKNTPTGNMVLPNEKINVSFNDAVIKETVEPNFVIEPKVEGRFDWADAKSFQFTPVQPLAKDTEYKVRFKPGVKSTIGGIIEAETGFEFRTIGAVKVASTSPSNGVSGSSIYTNVVITFDQEVDQVSAQSKFSISPTTNGSFAWEGNRMIYKSGTLSFNTKYSAKLDAGVKSKIGLDSKQGFNLSFTTQAEQYVLNVPQYYQVNKYDCNLVATRMVLAYRGVNVSLDNIVGGIGYATPRDRNGNYWGNPNQGYVGYRNGPGYGVHWGPVSSYINGFRSSQVMSGWNVQGLAQEIKNGNPVILWWNNGLSGDGPDSWDSPGGKVSTYVGMHSEVVVGVNGTVENPSSFIVNDPWRGRRTISIGTFKNLWSTFNNTGVVVY